MYSFAHTYRMHVLSPIHINLLTFVILSFLTDANNVLNEILQVISLIYAELSGDFPWEILGSQFIKVFGHLIWCLKTQTLLNSSMIIK